jgi:hypothetical protein
VSRHSHYADERLGTNRALEFSFWLSVAIHSSGEFIIVGRVEFEGTAEEA